MTELGVVGYIRKGKTLKSVFQRYGGMSVAE